MLHTLFIETWGLDYSRRLYETCVCHELAKCHVAFQRQLVLPISYDGMLIDAGLRLDLVVADQVIAELKAIDALLPVHEAQLLTYLKAYGETPGLFDYLQRPTSKSRP